LTLPRRLMPADDPSAVTARVAVEGLRRACADLKLLTEPADVSPYLTDHRRLFTGRAMAVALPDNVAQLSTLMSWCHAQSVGVVPQGGNTGYCGGATPDASGRQLVIALERMNRIRTLDAANDSMIVEAGCRLAQVQAAAASIERFFPLELGSAGSCQIGGNLATNAGGLNVLRFGMARDLTLGVEAVLPDGRVLQHLRALRKDNTGYHLTGLLIGSEGTLGIITAATLKLWPQQRRVATAFVAVPDPAAALALLGVLRRHAGERVNSFELLPRIAIDLTCRYVPGVTDPLGSLHDWYVLCELRDSMGESMDEKLDELLQQALLQATSEGLVRDAAMATNDRQRQSFWKLRESVPEAQRHAGAGVKHDVSVPVAALPAFLAEASRWVRESVPTGTLVAYGHAGDGNLHFNINWLDGTPTGAVAAQEPVIRRAIHDLVAGYDGSFSAEHGIGQLKVDELRRYTSAPEWDLMRAIKRAVDPKGIMNPGKVLSTG